MRDMSLGALRISAPVWAGSFLDSEALLPGGVKLDPAQFPSVVAPAFTVTMAADAAAGAVALTVDALAHAIPAGTVLNFGIPGKLAYVTKAAAAAATTVDVDPIAQAINDNDVAQVAAQNGAYVPSGTVIGRTLAERNAKTGFGPAAATDDEVFLVAFDIADVQKLEDADAVLPGDFVVKENFLPGFADLDPALVTKLRGLYILTLGAP